MANAIVWLRRDLRLADQPALNAAIERGFVPVPVYIHAPAEEHPWQPGGASHAWLDRSLRALADDLCTRGSKLTIRAGASLPCLRDLIAECAAEAVFWNRLYEPAIRARDGAIKQALRDVGVVVESFNAAQLSEPWTVQTGSGTPYKVFTPFWRTASAQLEVLAPPSAAPPRLPAPPLLESLPIDALKLRSNLGWDAEFWNHWTPGEAGAHARLHRFIDEAVARYHDDRNRPDLAGTSGLSAHLHFGEISPRQCVHALREIEFSPSQRAHADHFVRELGWREFSVHLLYHFPHTAEADLNPNFGDFAWVDPDPNLLAAWQKGRTGIPIVDAGMRELWHSGWMHNRVRMIVASLLTKNLRYHWRHGAAWFWDTLVDADLANNTQGWQWTAGTGADAAPYFRIFNPVTQGERFDPDGAYVRRWVPELSSLPNALIHSPWTDPGTLARLAPSYPRQPIVDLRESREAALAAYSASREKV
ncbi:MAG: cryptochrome/photolyase family protein [Pseudomarimonas sp.]